MTRTRLYRSGVLETENFPVQDISEHITQPGVTVWLDMCAPDADDLATISEELHLHRLAVEDAVQERQRPKLDRYA
jgi:magnesium transporter